ncbi:MarR family winged helix-turn-helix transcriptional regulator [Peribacillus kribbensis]|uniref:MarR family winged helix-turn-helix transcriptional regulator n=1 Tax=Peribacillus kribbensis TaxID=356658 RepID=UPI000405F65A|nr:MarR family transcriptional regulator [Peribacillus kribbensis]
MDFNDEKVKKAAELIQSFLNVIKTTTDFSRQNAESLGLSLQQMSIINILFSFPGSTLKNVTEKLSISKSTGSISVDGLVKSGLVERSLSETDRREISLKLTPKGEELSKKSQENAYSYKAMMIALEQFNDQEVSSLLKMHHELLSGLKAVQL